jgi:hypothetical protein
LFSLFMMIPEDWVCFPTGFNVWGCLSYCSFCTVMETLSLRLERLPFCKRRSTIWSAVQTPMHPFLRVHSHPPPLPFFCTSNRAP